MYGSVAHHAVGVYSHVAVRHQAVTVAEVPDKVHEGGRSQIPARVVDEHFEDDVRVLDEDIL